MTDEIYRPGLEGVIAGETAISTIAGGLSYRGYSIEDLAQHGTFEETAFLILNGELPTASQLNEFHKQLTLAASIPDEVTTALKLLPRDSNMMDVMRTGASLLSHWDPDRDDNSHDANLRKTLRLTAQLPVVLATAYRLRYDQALVASEPTLSFAANLLWMINGVAPTAEATRAMDISLILYAEHEYNASTFTSRVVASTLSDLHSGVTAAIGALKGPLHGGANERVLEVLQEVGSLAAAKTWVRQALDEKRKIMGFGHRVYKTGDPRATFLKPLCDELAEQTGNQELEQMAEVIETTVRSEKKLPPNLDWPSARLYHYLGLAVELYTPLFVVSRVVGWSAHIIEQLDNNRIIRPRSKYTGTPIRPWLSVEDR